MSHISPFFIVGSGRSGTTLLRRLLNRHSLVCVPEETHFIPRMVKPFTRLIRRGQYLQAVALLNNLPIIQRWRVRIEPEEIENLDADVAYARAIHLLMSRKAASHGKRFWGEKSPEYVFHIPLLKTLFPTARFIHIYRDGRDVALSVMPLKWGPNNVYAAARWWVKAIQAWQAACVDLRGGVEVCYEDFVKNPSAELQRICEFLGIPYEAGMLDGYVIHSNRFGRWKNKFYMSSKEREIFEAVAGDALRELGYELSVENPCIHLGLSILSMLDEVYKRLSNRVLRQ